MVAFTYSIRRALQDIEIVLQKTDKSIPIHYLARGTKILHKTNLYPAWKVQVWERNYLQEISIINEALNLPQLTDEERGELMWTRSISYSNMRDERSAIKDLKVRCSLQIR